MASMSRAGALQEQLNQSEAALSTALSQNAALTADLAEVNSLLAKVCVHRSVQRCCTVTEGMMQIITKRSTSSTANTHLLCLTNTAGRRQHCCCGFIFKADCSFLDLELRNEALLWELWLILQPVCCLIFFLG